MEILIQTFVTYSQAKKEVLINTMINAIPTHIMSYFKAPMDGVEKHHGRDRRRRKKESTRSLE